MRRIWVTMATAACLALACWQWCASDQSFGPTVSSAGGDRISSPGVGSGREADPVSGVDRRQIGTGALDPTALKPVVAAATSGGLVVQVTWGDDAPAADVGVAVVERRSGRSDVRRIGLTDERGEVRFEDLPAASYAVATHGVEPAEVETVVGSTVSIRLRAPRGFGVEGRVVDALGSPVAGAVLWLMPGGGQLDHRRALPVTRSGPDGRFRVAQLALGVRTFLSARAAGSGPSAWHEVFAGGPTEAVDALRGIELRLTRAIGTVAGRCLAEDGSPVAGARVHAVPLGLAWSNADGGRSWPGHEYRVASEDDGAFRLDDLTIGTWRLSARADGLWFESAETTLATALGVQQLELVGRPAAALEGVVRDPEGEPIEGALVRVQGRSDARSHSGADGGWEIRDLPAATLELRCWAEGYADAHPRELETAAGEITRVDFELLPRPRLFGVARFASGDPVAGWRIGALPADQQSPSWVPSEVLPPDGHFELFVDESVPHRFYVCGPESRFPTALHGAGSVLPSDEALDLVLPVQAQADSWLVGVVEDAREDLLVRPKLVRVGRRGAQGPAEFDAASGAFRSGPLPRGGYELLLAARRKDGSQYGKQVVGRSRFGPFRVPRSQTFDVGELGLPAVAALEIEPTIAPGCTPQAVRLQWRGRDEESTAGLLQLDGPEPATIDIVPGDYAFTIWGEGFLSIERELTVLPPPSPATRFEVTLRAGQRLPIRLELPPGERSATFTIREAGSGRLAYEEAFGTDEARAVNRFPVLGLGRHLVECVGASGDRFAGEFEIESLTPTREPRRIELHRR